MTRPIIGINCDSFAQNGPIDGLRPAYARAVERAGGIPVLIPPYENLDSLQTLLGRLNAVLLTGGDDILPERLGIEEHPGILPMTPERDRADFALIDMIQRIKIPTLAICLGCQELNVARGGNLWVDLDTEKPGPIAHHTGTPGVSAFHPVRIEPDSALGRIWPGSSEVRVNSRHHQAIRAVGSGIRPLAYSPDGLIEAIQLDDHPFLIGVQWHPENLACESDPFAEKLFEALVAHALK